jgi:hypothetical protein
MPSIWQGDDKGRLVKLITSQIKAFFMKMTFKFCNIYLLLVASLLMLTSPLTAQTGRCLADMPPSFPEPPTSSNLWCYPQSKEYNIRIAFHIVRGLNGTGGTTQAELDKAIAILKNDFSPTITFDIVKIDNVTSTVAKNYFVDNAYRLPNISGGTVPPLFYDLVQENFVPKAVNVYLGPSTNVNEGGIASPSRLACTVGGSRVDVAGTPAKYLVTSRAISHEVAHVLGLFHTFQANGVALVNGQDCGTTGDYVCDTPADPTQPLTNLPNYFDFRTLLANCVWNNTTKVDANGQLYQPFTNNIMAYTHIGCMTKFTDGQFRRMHNACLTSTDLQPAVTVSPLNWFSCGGSSSSYLRIMVPNPVSEFLHIHFLSDSKETEVQITDIMGKSLYKKSLGRTTKQDVQEIDIKTLPKGMYILTIFNESDKKTTKIVVQ